MTMHPGPRLEMAPHTCIFTGCFGRGFIDMQPFLWNAKVANLSSETVDSSVKMQSWKVSPLSIHAWACTTLLILLTSLIIGYAL
ncbi:hypothetical protein FKM82_000442 [Ascaphus truei]